MTISSSRSRMFHRLAWIVPGVVVWFMASWALKENLFWLVFVHKAAEIYIVVCIILTVIAFIEGWYSIYQMKPISEGRSIKGYVQLVETLIGFTGILIIISILFRIQMTNVVAGLGAATAVLGHCIQGHNSGAGGQCAAFTEQDAQSGRLDNNSRKAY